MASYSETDIIRLFGFEQDAFDDVAYLRHPAGKKLVLAADSMAEGSHFRLDWNSPEDIARKLLTSNVSDFAAGRARPVYAVLSVGIDPGRVSLEWVSRFAGRLKSLVARSGIQIAGGDTVRSERLFFHITLTGYADKSASMNAARPGQKVYLSRPVGYSGLGYGICAAMDDGPSGPGGGEPEDSRAWPDGLWGLPSPSDPAAAEILAGVRDLLRRRIHGVGQPEEIGLSRENQVPRRNGRFGIYRSLAAFLAPYPPGPLPEQAISATDLSDGLAVDLGRWARAAGCGFSIQLDDLVHSPMWRGAQPDEAARRILGSGEEYALVYTVPEDSPVSDGIFIGWATEQPGVRFALDGRTIDVQPDGFRHFE